MQSVNLQIAPTGISPVINVSQNDIGRQFQLVLYEGSQAYTLPGGTTAQIDGIKPDRHGFSYTDAVSVSGNVVTVTTKQQMTIVPGTVECEIRLTKSGLDLGTLNFKLLVEKSPIDGDTDISDTELPAIFALAREQEQNAEAWAAGTKAGVPVGPDAEQYENNAKYYAEHVGDYVYDSEAWAKGTKNGVPVSSSDETYHNNSKYYSQQSASSASAASSSAGTANTYKQEAEAWAKGTKNGTPVPSSDVTYENNSKYYAQEASNSADTANSYADDAQDSAEAALSSEQNAAASEAILAYYTNFVIPQFVIQNNRLYMIDAAAVNFIVQNNRLYIKHASS